MTKALIGREFEIKLIQKYCESPKAELVAVYGRRRVGKTFLIKQYFGNQFDFYFTGSFETAKNIQSYALHAGRIEFYGHSMYKKPTDVA